MQITNANLAKLPDQAFLTAAVGELNQKPPCNIISALGTLCKIRGVSHKLRQKVDDCWGVFIEQADDVSFLILPPRTMDRTAAFKFLTKQYPILKKWADTDPEVSRRALAGSLEQAIITNHLGSPELWVMHPRRILKRIDLTNQQSGIWKSEHFVNKISSECVLPIASTEKWVALCCYDAENRREINIVELSAMDPHKVVGLNGYHHKITEIGLISHLQADQEFLYVFTKDSSEQLKLLRYDSNDWNAAPIELCLPGKKVEKFYLTPHELLFSIRDNDNKYQLLAAKKEDCFSNSKTSFIDMPAQSECPQMKITHGRFFMVDSNASSNSNEPSTMLSELHVNDSTINKEPLQTLSVDPSKILDLLVRLDRIFILKRNEDNTDYEIACFNSDGTFIKNIISTEKPFEGTHSQAQLISTPDRIQLIYCSQFDTGRSLDVDNVSMTLDYGESKA